jgi:hypothetical protein
MLQGASRLGTRLGPLLHCGLAAYDSYLFAALCQDLLCQLQLLKHLTARGIKKRTASECSKAVRSKITLHSILGLGPKMGWYLVQPDSYESVCLKESCLQHSIMICRLNRIIKSSQLVSAMTRSPNQYYSFTNFSSMLDPLSNWICNKYMPEAHACTSSINKVW